LRYIAGDHRTSTNDGIIADRHARKDDCAAPHPNVSSYHNGPPKLGPRSSNGRIARMICGVDLDGRSNLRPGTDCDCTNIQDNAIEVEKYARSDPNVVAKIAMKWWPDDRGVSYVGQQFSKKREPFRCGGCQGAVVTNHPPLRIRLVCLNFWITGVVQFTGKHFLFLCRHDAHRSLRSLRSILARSIAGEVGFFTFALKFDVSGDTVRLLLSCLEERRKP
jgi:hypothetical protein